MEDQITRIFDLKTEGNRQFILEYHRGVWIAAIGNRSPFVSLGKAVTYGDANADFIARGSSAREALDALARKMAPS